MALNPSKAFFFWRLLDGLRGGGLTLNAPLFHQPFQFLGKSPAKEPFGPSVAVFLF